MELPLRVVQSPTVVGATGFVCLEDVGANFHWCSYFLCAVLKSLATDFCICRTKMLDMPAPDTEKALHVIYCTVVELMTLCKQAAGHVDTISCTSASSYFECL